MTIRENEDLWKTFNLYEDNILVDRDINVSFTMAMMTQIDELNNDRHIQMNFVEFLEAFSRIAEKFSPIPIDENPDDW